MQTLREFITQQGLRMTAERVDTNPGMDEESARRMDHWRCLILAPRPGKVGRRKSFSVHFSQGFGHNGKEPKLSSVLDCLASDASGLENARDFEDWASEYGYDTDSRKAEKTFRTIQRQAARLKAFLGEDAYKSLLWNTERE